MIKLIQMILQFLVVPHEQRGGALNEFIQVLSEVKAARAAGRKIDTQSGSLAARQLANHLRLMLMKESMREIKKRAILFDLLPQKATFRFQHSGNLYQKEGTGAVALDGSHKFLYPKGDLICFRVC